jgi:hypothetical protein
MDNLHDVCWGVGFRVKGYCWVKLLNYFCLFLRRLDVILDSRYNSQKIGLCMMMPLQCGHHLRRPFRLNCLAELLRMWGHSYWWNHQVY